jgi:uracil-DNA glycosylase family 4
MNEQFFDLGEHTPKSREKPPETSKLQKEIQEQKQIAKEKLEAEINEILQNKDKILKNLLRGIHYHPDGEDGLPEHTWLAGRGGAGIKTPDGTLAKVAFVGLYPGRQEIHHKPKPAVLVGPSGRFLDKILSYCIEDLNSVYRTNLIKYYKKPKSKISTAEKFVGKTILFEELQTLGITHVICLGSEVYEALCNDNKRFPSAAFRGIFLPPEKARIPVKISGLHNPAHIISPAGEKDAQAFEDALRNLFDTIQHGEKEKETPPFANIESIAGALDWWLEFQDHAHRQKTNGKQTILSLDTETVVSNTNGLKPEETILISSSYGTKEATSIQELRNHTWTFSKTRNGITKHRKPMNPRKHFLK